MHADIRRVALVTMVLFSSMVYFIWNVHMLIIIQNYIIQPFYTQVGCLYFHSVYFADPSYLCCILSLLLDGRYTNARYNTIVWEKLVVGNIHEKNFRGKIFLS